MTLYNEKPLNAGTIQEMGFAGFPSGAPEKIDAWSRPAEMRVCPAPEFYSALQANQAQPDQNNYQRQVWSPLNLLKPVNTKDPLEQVHTYQHRSSWRLMMQLILHYTQPGELVLDGMCGSGTTGVAAQLCGSPQAIRNLGYYSDQDKIFNKEKQQIAQLGQRRALLTDLSPLAVVQAYSVNYPPTQSDFNQQQQKLLARLEIKTDWMYLTAPLGQHKLAEQLAAELEEAEDIAQIKALMKASQNQLRPLEHVIWGPQVQCPHCQRETDLWREEILLRSVSLQQQRPVCSHCRKRLKPESVKFLTTPQGELLLKPLLIEFRENSQTVLKLPDRLDLVLHQSLQRFADSLEIPSDSVPESICSGTRGFGKYLHTLKDMHLPRSRFSLNWLGNHLPHHPALPLSCFPEMVARMSLLRAVDYVINQEQTGIELRPLKFIKLPAFPLLETRPELLLKKYFARFEKLIQELPDTRSIRICTASLGGDLPQLVAEATVDFAFLDPPYPSQLTHADSNFLAESWIGVQTARPQEMMVSSDGSDDYRRYQQQLQKIFRSVYTALKPGRWACLVMSEKNPQNWSKNIFTLALEKEGFVVISRQTGIITQEADGYPESSVQPLQELEDFRLISCYKPAFSAGLPLAEQVNRFITDYLERIPLIYPNRSEATLPIERNQYELERRISHYLLGEPFLRLFDEPPTKQQIRGQIRDFIHNHLKLREGFCFLPEQLISIQERYGGVTCLQLPQIHPALLVDFTTNSEYLIQDLKSWLFRPREAEEVERRYRDLFRFSADKQAQIDFRKLLEQYFIRQADGRWRLPQPEEELQLRQRREQVWQTEFRQALNEGPKALKKLNNQVLLAGLMAALQRDETELLNQFSNLQLIPYERIGDDQRLLALYERILIA